MASKLKIKKLYNSRSGGGSAGADANRTANNYYVDDKHYGDLLSNQYIDNTFIEASGEESNAGLNFQPKINYFKTCELYFGSKITPSINFDQTGQNDSWGNWRTLSSIKVNPNVMLNPDSNVVSLEFTNEFDPVWDKIMENPLLGKVNELASNARLISTAINGLGSDPDKNNPALATEAVLQPKYKKVPAYKSTSPLKMPALKFKFEFGQAGLFSAEEEVVKPILALLLICSPIEETGDKAGWIRHPFVDSLERQKAVIVAKLSSSIKGSEGDNNSPWSLLTSGSSDSGSDKKASKGGGIGGALLNFAGGAAETVATAATNIQNLLYKTFNNSLKELNNQIIKCVFRIGRFTSVPLLIKNVKVSFDFTNVDEFGFPCSGEFEIVDWEAAETYESSQIGYR